MEKQGFGLCRFSSKALPGCSIPRALVIKWLRRAGRCLSEVRTALQLGLHRGFGE